MCEVEPSRRSCKILAESVVDGERDDERSDAGGDSEDGDPGDDADEGLPAFGAQISGCDEEFEAHEKQLSAFSHQLSARRIIDGD